jgi:hypothetical protein
MTRGLRRYQQTGDIHFIMFSCCRRDSLSAKLQARDTFVVDDRPWRVHHPTLQAKRTRPSSFDCRQELGPTLQVQPRRSRSIYVFLNGLADGLNFVLRCFRVRNLANRKSTSQSHCGVDDARHREVRTFIPNLGRHLLRSRGLAHVAQGAEVFIADVTDAAALTKAFQNADSAYVLIPPNPTSNDPLAYSERVCDAIATALKNAGVKHVVALSSIGADKNQGTGPVVGLHKLEQNSTRSTAPTYSFCSPSPSWKTPCRKLPSFRRWASSAARFAPTSNFQ